MSAFLEKSNEIWQIAQKAFVIPVLSIYFCSVYISQVNHGDTQAKLGKSRRKEYNA